MLPHQQSAPPDAIAMEETRAKALELRAGGANYRQIAKTLGIGVSTAYEYVNQGLEEIRLFNVEQTAEVKRLELHRLDAMLLSLWNKRDLPRHADTILRIMERRAKLLGLDAPLRWEGSGPGGGPIPIGAGEIDLTKLSVEELRQLEHIVDVAASMAQTGQAKASIAVGPGPEIPVTTAGDDDRRLDAGMAETLSTVEAPPVTHQATQNGDHP